MKISIYTFAETATEIVSIYEDVHRRCEAYRCGTFPQLSVQTTPKDIACARQALTAIDPIAGRRSTDGYLEFCAILPLLAEKMIRWDILLFHASAVAMDGEAYLFAAKSGTGKSTHARYWREYFGERVVMINDDKPFLRVADGNVTAYGSPWCGKHGLHTNIAVPVKAICLLERSDENFITPLTAREAFPTLYRQTCQMENREGKLKELTLLDQLAKSVRLYRLGVNMSPEAARVAYEGMNGGSHETEGHFHYL